MTKRSRHSCYYCGAVGLPSREHVLSEWLQDVLPLTSTASVHSVEHRKRVAGTGRVVETMQSKGRFTRPGDPLSLTARTACEACNQTWMSQIVGRAKAPLKRLILLDWSPLSNEERVAVASWCALVTMNYEFGDPKTAAIPQVDRDYIRIEQRPPLGWRMWVAKYSQLSPRKWHRGMTLVSPGLPVPNACNTQTTLFNAGLALFQTASSTAVHCDLSRIEHHPDWHVIPLWPVMGSRVPNFALGPEHMAQIVDWFSALTAEFRPVSRFSVLGSPSTKSEQTSRPSPCA